MTVLAAMPMSVRRPRGRIEKTIWTNQTPPPHEFLVAICPDSEDGGFSAFALRYPGIVSQGETFDETKANIAEAFLAMLEACRKRGKSLEYSEARLDLPADCQKVWITVDG